MLHNTHIISCQGMVSISVLDNSVVLSACAEGKGQPTQDPRFTRMR